MPVGGGVFFFFFALVPVFFEISRYVAWPKEDALNIIKFWWLKDEQELIFTFFIKKKTPKKTIGLTYMFDRGYVLWSLVPTLMQVHFHCTTHGYIVLKEESCSYSSEFCYASFQVIPQY